MTEAQPVDLAAVDRAFLGCRAGGRTTSPFRLPKVSAGRKRTNYRRDLYQALAEQYIAERETRHGKMMFVDLPANAGGGFYGQAGRVWRRVDRSTVIVGLIEILSRHNEFGRDECRRLWEHVCRTILADDSFIVPAA